MTQRMLEVPGYRLHKRLGKGRMAEVYLATQLSLDREVAVKVLLRTEDAAFTERFIQEGQEAGVFSKNVNIPLIKTTILGSYFNLYYNKKFFQAMHNLQDQFNFEEYVEKELIPHIQQTIKALLTYEV